VSHREVPVLVVGGSLVGLTTSVLLASAGVPHLLVERHRGTAVHPRAASFHQRTMEIFRSVGLQSAVEAAAEKEFAQNGAIVSVEHLAAPEENSTYFFRHFNEGVEQLSPTARLFITQIGLEPLLRQAALDRGAEHRYATELVGVDQDDTGVTCAIRSRGDGPEETVRAQYLVAADGAHSRVRELAGIRQEGRGTFADCVTIYFRADMRELIGDRNLSVVYVNHPELLGFFRFSITGDSGFLAVFSTTEPDGSRDTHVAVDLDVSRCEELVRKALGRSDIHVQVDNVQRWSAAAAWASSFRDRRVFLAGDAAHVMPPTGGFGGNTGVADAHDLAWKLAMVIAGAAGPGLLDTYDSERRPVSAMVVEQAYTRYVLRVDPSLPRDDMAAPLDDASIELGPVYRSAAVLRSDDETDDDAAVVDPREPGGRPGTRAPHLVVEFEGAPLSLLDLFDSAFVLLAGPGGQVWCDAADGVSAELGVPLVAHRVAPDGSLIDRDQAFPVAYGTGDGGAVVVRPDGIVAWRTTDAAPDPGVELGGVLRRVLAR
jgi:2-polyprenyl-6-methoxyphenol hydroxylase-like FAD-dependent oxidoreductase